MMNRIAALVISTILLTQIASYSFGEIPAKVEWEEPLQGDSDWKVSGRNNSSGCNSSSVWFEVEAYQQEWNAYDTVSVYLDTYCGIWNNSYMVSWWVIDNANNSIIDYGNTSFETNSSSVSYHPNHTYHFNEHDIHLHYMETGNYTVFGHFSVWLNNSWSFLSNESSTFEVNSTMTTTVCGFNSTLIDMETDLQPTVYFADSSVHPWSDIECPMLNTAYMYTWEMYNLNTSTVTHSGVQNFTATWQNVNMFSDGSGFYYDLYPHAYNLTEGAYFLNTTLRLASGGLLDASNVSFSVIPDYWNNTGGNNTGGNNTGGNNTGGNNTGGNNTGGNNTGGNNTGGNNTGGNNTGGNNTGGNNTDTNNTGGMGSNPGNPIMPVIDCSRIDWNGTFTNVNMTNNITIDDCLNGTDSFWFEFNNTGGIVWIDPEVAVGYDYFVYGGPKITGVNIPLGYGDNAFDLFLFDSVTGWYDTGINIEAGLTHTFNPPTDNMSIRGIETSEMLDPTDPTEFVSGLIFETNGTVVMTMTPVTQNITCGVSDDLTELMIWTSSNVYVVGYDFIPAYYEVNCSTNGEDYILDVYLQDSSGMSVAFNSWNWTETDSYESMQDNWTGLGVGTYCINASLWMNVSTGVDWKVTCFEVIDNSGGNNTGGNNTGGNNTGGNNTGGNNTDGVNTSPVSYQATNLDDNDCLDPGENLSIQFWVSNGTGTEHTIEWVFYEINGGTEGPYTQNVTLDSSGYGTFVWESDVSNWSEGSYALAISINSMYYKWFYFDVGCSGCGYDSSLIGAEYEVWSQAFGTIFASWNETNTSSNSANDDTPVVYIGDSLGTWVQVSCLVYGEEYLANATITNEANQVVFSAEEYFTQPSFSTWYQFYERSISTALLIPGEYCLSFTLYASPNGSNDVVYTISSCVDLVTLDDWDGCGTNHTHIDHKQEVVGNPFVQPNTVFLTTSEIWFQNYVDCLVIGENYTMVTDVTKDGAPHSQTTDNFTVNQFSDITQWSWEYFSWTFTSQIVPVGNYCVETTIHLTDSTYTNLLSMVSTVTDCFAVVEIDPVNWWDEQTNNTTGSPNNPIMPDTNCSDLNSSLTGLNLTNSFNMTDCENGTGFWFNLTVNGTGINWYDPVYAVGYDYEVISGPKFASIVVPPGYGDDKFDLYLWDGMDYELVGSDLDALTQYWFTDDGGITTTPGDYEGITMFSIRGLELDAKLDPDDPNAFVTGMTFVQDPNEVSEVILSMNPIRVSDEDDDGIADEDDNCVDDANPLQEDADSNGIGDACENLATTDGDGDSEEDDKSDSDSDSNKTLAYAALLAVALVAVLVMFGREEER